MWWAIKSSSNNLCCLHRFGASLMKKLVEGIPYLALFKMLLFDDLSCQCSPMLDTSVQTPFSYNYIGYSFCKTFSYDENYNVLLMDGSMRRSLSFLISFGSSSTLSDISTVTSTFPLGLFAWNTFFLSFNPKWVSVFCGEMCFLGGNKYTLLSYFLSNLHPSLCLLIGELTPLLFRVIIEMCVLIPAILMVLWCLSFFPLFFSCCEAG